MSRTTPGRRTKGSVPSSTVWPDLHTADSSWRFCPCSMSSKMHAANPACPRPSPRTAAQVCTRRQRYRSPGRRSTRRRGTARLRSSSPTAATGSPGSGSKTVRPSSGAASREALMPVASSVRPTAPSSTRDEVWHYYTAVNTMHGGPMPPKTITIGRATWRLDGFVSLDAGHFGGVVETVLLQAAGGRLVVNADAGGGRLEIEVLTAEGSAAGGVHARTSVRQFKPTACARRWSGRGTRACLPASRCTCAFICEMPVSTASASTGSDAS